MSIYSNDNISKIAKLTTRELPHLAKTAKITVRENNGIYSTYFQCLYLKMSISVTLSSLSHIFMQFFFSPLLKSLASGQNLLVAGSTAIQLLLLLFFWRGGGGRGEGPSKLSESYQLIWEFATLGG